MAESKCERCPFRLHLVTFFDCPCDTDCKNGENYDKLFPQYPNGVPEKGKAK
jgi:hypothetical protein